MNCCKFLIILIILNVAQSKYFIYFISSCDIFVYELVALVWAKPVSPQGPAGLPTAIPFGADVVAMLNTQFAAFLSMICIASETSFILHVAYVLKSKLSTGTLPNLSMLNATIRNTRF